MISNLDERNRVVDDRDCSRVGVHVRMRRVEMGCKKCS